MRRTLLKRTSITVVVTLVAVAVLLAILRTFVIRPAASLARDGLELFENKGCAQCHFTDSRERKMGPGLEGLFKRERLPASGWKATEENVRKQLDTPYKNMPSFADRLTREETDRLISFLKTL